MKGAERLPRPFFARHRHNCAAEEPNQQSINGPSPMHRSYFFAADFFAAGFFLSATM
jgi:hypothetical protein